MSVCAVTGVFNVCVCLCSEPRGSFFSLAVIVANSVSIDELPGVDGSTEGLFGSTHGPPSCLFLPTHQQKHQEEVITVREEKEEGEQRKGRAVEYEDEKEGERERAEICFAR